MNWIYIDSIIFVALVTIGIIIYFLRKRAIKKRGYPKITHVDWVARKAFITSFTGMKHDFDFRDTSRSLIIDARYFVSASPNATNVYIKDAAEDGKIVDELNYKV
jgi:hypothetical protein